MSTELFNLKATVTRQKRRIHSLERELLKKDAVIEELRLLLFKLDRIEGPVPVFDLDNKRRG